MIDFRYEPPSVDVADPQAALNRLWSFVSGLGFDPNAVLSAYDAEMPFALGHNIGRLSTLLERHVPRDALAPFLAAAAPAPSPDRGDESSADQNPQIPERRDALSISDVVRMGGEGALLAFLSECLVLQRPCGVRTVCVDAKSAQMHASLVAATLELSATSAQVLYALFAERVVPLGDEFASAELAKHLGWR